MTQDDPQTMLETAYPKTPQNETVQGQSLTTRDGYLFFLIDMLDLGRAKPQEWPWRQYGALSAWAKLYADVQGWVPKTPINLTVAQHMEGSKVDAKELVKAMNEEGKEAVTRAIIAIEQAESKTRIGV